MSTASTYQLTDHVHLVDGYRQLSDTLIYLTHTQRVHGSVTPRSKPASHTPVDASTTSTATSASLDTTRTKLYRTLELHTSHTHTHLHALRLTSLQITQECHSLTLKRIRNCDHILARVCARGSDSMRLSPVSPLHGRYDISDSYGT